MTENKKIELKRVNINLPTDLVDRVKSYGEKLGLNTTSAYIVLLNQALNQQDSLNFMPLLSRMVNEVQGNMINNNLTPKDQIDELALLISNNTKNQSKDE